MARRRTLQDAEKAASFETLKASGMTVAQAAWLSGVDEPTATESQLADRLMQWEADKPGVPVAPPEDEPKEELGK